MLQHFIGRALQICRTGTDTADPRCQRDVQIAHGTDDVFRHFFLVRLKCTDIFGGFCKDIQRVFQVRVTVGYEISIAIRLEAAHTTVSAAFDTDFRPQILISQDGF